VSIFTK